MKEETRQTILSIVIGILVLIILIATMVLVLYDISIQCADNACMTMNVTNLVGGY